MASTQRYSLRGSGPDAVARYAGRLFDRFREDPIPARILAWESLELDTPAAAERRSNLCATGVTALQHALPKLDKAAAAHLLLSIVTLTAGWWTLAHLGNVILAGTITDDTRREVVVRQARELAAAANEIDAQTHSSAPQRKASAS